MRRPLTYTSLQSLYVLLERRISSATRTQRYLASTAHKANRIGNAAAQNHETLYRLIKGLPRSHILKLFGPCTEMHLRYGFFQIAV